MIVLLSRQTCRYRAPREPLVRSVECHNDDVTELLSTDLKRLILVPGYYLHVPLSVRKLVSRITCSQFCMSCYSKSSIIDVCDFTLLTYPRDSSPCAQPVFRFCVRCGYRKGGGATRIDQGKEGRHEDCESRRSRRACTIYDVFRPTQRVQSLDPLMDIS